MRLITFFLLASLTASSQSTMYFRDTTGSSIERRKTKIKTLAQLNGDSVWINMNVFQAVQVPKSIFVPADYTVPTWTTLEGVPSTFTPSTHTHDWTSGITGKPATFTPATHSHDYSGSDITNKPTIPTNNNQLTNGSGFLVAADITGKANTSHTHATSDINSGTLADARVAQSNVTQHQSSLSIAQSQVPNLVNDLAGKSATGHTHTDLLNDDPDFKAYALLGSPFLAQTVGCPVQNANTSSNLTDGQIRWQAAYLAKGATVTGLRVYVRVLGAYTGDNNNKIGLYSYSAGTLTKVAESTNSATLWTGSANAFQTIAFATPYVATSNIYFTAILYNNSAQTTAPGLAVCTALNNAAMATLGFTNSAKLYGTSNGADLPASIAMSAITATTVITLTALY